MTFRPAASRLTEFGGQEDSAVFLVDQLGTLLGWNQDTITILASAAITANASSANQVNVNGRGLLLFINTGAFGVGASGITVTVQGVDPVSGQVYTILASAALTASTFTVLRIYPGLTAAANAVASDVLPRTWNVKWAGTWGSGGSVLGIAACVIV